MSKAYRYVTYFLLLLMVPEIAMANVVIPLLSLTYPMMWLMLIAVIAIEYLVLRNSWPNIRKKELLRDVGLGNFVSTMVAMPVVWFIHFYGLSKPLSLIERYNQDFINAMPYCVKVVMVGIVYAPILNFSSGWVFNIYQLILLLLPTYFLSYWIEYGFVNNLVVANKAILKEVRKANRYSYLFIFIFMSAWFVAMEQNWVRSLGEWLI